jgi:hypothetical protein
MGSSSGCEVFGYEQIAAQLSGDEWSRSKEGASLLWVLVQYWKAKMEMSLSKEPHFRFFDSKNLSRKALFGAEDEGLLMN